MAKSVTTETVETTLQAVRGLLDERTTAARTISRGELHRQATAEGLGEDVDRAIDDLPPGQYTRAGLEAELMPAIERRVRSRLAGLGGGPAEPTGKKGSRQGKQRGRR